MGINLLAFDSSLQIPGKYYPWKGNKNFNIRLSLEFYDMTVVVNEYLEFALR